MATNVLALYNIALASLGERVLDSTAENRETRKQLDMIYAAGNGAINYWLEQGMWNFAMRETTSTASASTGNFNFRYSHDKPTDFVRLSAISLDQTFGSLVTRYEFQATHIRAETDTLYLRYVSNTTAYGNDLTKWPDSFIQWAGHWLGVQVAPYAVTAGNSNIDIPSLKRDAHRLLVDARSKDGQQEPVRFQPMGNWARARLGRRGGDRGSRSQLT